MNEEIIKDFYNRIVGYIRTDSRGNKEGFDFYRRPVGKYIKSENLTKDFYNRIYAKGDALTSLIFQSSGKK